MYRLVAIGLSAGGQPLIQKLLRAMPQDFPLPIAIVVHLPGDVATSLAELFGRSSPLQVSMATDKEPLEKGHVYLAPPGYHLLIEVNSKSTLRFALSVDEPVQSVRPSIDVLFESAAEALESDLIAVLLSGANSDGAEGMATVKKLGGVSVVLDPQTCEFDTMPLAAIKRTEVDYVLDIDEIISLLLEVTERA